MEFDTLDRLQGFFSFPFILLAVATGTKVVYFVLTLAWIIE